MEGATNLDIKRNKKRTNIGIENTSKGRVSRKPSSPRQLNGLNWTILVLIEHLQNRDPQFKFLRQSQFWPQIPISGDQHCGRHFIPHQFCYILQENFTPESEEETTNPYTLNYLQVEVTDVVDFFIFFFVMFFVCF